MDKIHWMRVAGLHGLPPEVAGVTTEMVATFARTGRPLSRL